MSLFDRSRGGWSGDEAPSGGEPYEDERYEWRDELGRGGMGFVHAVFDERLCREVAMKVVRPSDAAAVHRATREAEITARLEHPAIVPVYDAGTTDDGRHYFTMRMVRGRSLAAEFARRPRFEDRVALLRSYLTCCEAIAYAHDNGVVHRDLKPANVMVGEFGEVQVVDWGLAAVDGDAPPGEVASSVVGTEGYAAPEQLGGAPIDQRSDVFGLGAILRDLLDAEGTVPEDLRAVADKACARQPVDRYPSAGALARDVERFLEGRRVSSHAYSSWDLARRFVGAYARQLALGALITVAAFVGVVVAYARVDDARDLALAAEQQARAALNAQSEAYAWAVEAHAVGELESGARAEAEVLALEVLGRHASPLARGILMRAHAGGRPQARRNHTSVRCDRYAFGIAGFVCLRGETVSLFRDGASEPAWTIEATADDAEFGRHHVALAGPRAVELVAVRDGAPVATLVDTNMLKRVVSGPGGRLGASFGASLVDVDSDGHPRRFSPCNGPGTIAIGLGPDLAAAVCAGGWLVVERDEGSEAHTRSRVAVPFQRDARLGDAFTLAVDESGEHVVLGGLHGHVAVVDLGTGVVHGPWKVADRAIARLAFIDHDRALASTDGGLAFVIDLSGGGLAFALPRVVSGRARVHDGLVTGSLGPDRWVWEVPRRARASTFQAPSGLSSGAFDPRGRWVALARGDGTVSVMDLTTGASVLDLRVSERVIKRLAFDADGNRLFVAVAAEDGAYLVDTSTWIVKHLPGTNALRRVVRTTDGATRQPVFMAAGYGDVTHYWSTEGERSDRAGPQTVDLAVAQDGALVAGLAADGTVRILRDGAQIGSHSAPFADTVAVADDGRLALAQPGRVELVSASGEAEVVMQLDAEPEDIAFTPDGRHLVVGTVRGELWVWRTDGALVARIHDATDRVAWVGFAPDGRLAAASWDGALRLYALDVLDMSVDALEDDARATWRVTLDEALRGK